MNKRSFFKILICGTGERVQPWLWSETPSQNNQTDPDSIPSTHVATPNCVPYACSTHMGLKRAPEPWEWELQSGGSPHRLAAGNQTLVFYGNRNVVKPSAISSALNYILNVVNAVLSQPCLCSCLAEWTKHAVLPRSAGLWFACLPSYRLFLTVRGEKSLVSLLKTWVIPQH